MSSPKSRIEQVIASVPQSATAARVVSRGEHYEPAINYGDHRHSDTPIATFALNEITNPQHLARARQIIGVKFGRFTVIGYAREQNPNKNARWVVRCSCGNYEIRKAKAIRNRTNSEDRCQDCRHLAYIQRTYEQLGSRAVSEFVQPAPRPVTKNRPAVEGPGNGSYKPGTPVGDPKAADRDRRRIGAGLGATFADVWPGARP